MASLTQWTWICARRWWKTRKSGMLQSIGLQIFGHNWATEQIIYELMIYPLPSYEDFWAKECGVKRCVLKGRLSQQTGRGISLLLWHWKWPESLPPPFPGMGMKDKMFQSAWKARTGLSTAANLTVSKGRGKGNCQVLAWQNNYITEQTWLHIRSSPFLELSHASFASFVKVSSL